jgi:thioredoxin reductase (NADPH)
MEKLVIIGSGPAAWTAALYASRANLEPLVFEGAFTEDNRLKGTLPLGQLSLTTDVENYPGFPEGVKGPDLMERFRAQAIRFGTRVITDDIRSVDFARHPFRLTPLEQPSVQALSVIIATGARANYLGLESEERFKNLGVSACAMCEGLLPRFRNKPLVVVGGGDSAAEEGTYLTPFASKVYVVHRREQLKASKILQQRLLSNPKIEMKWNRIVTDVLGNDKDGVTGVRLASTVDDGTEELATAGMFVAIGHTPNTDFLGDQVELDENGYIKWRQINRTCTSVEGVFAAGDVADNYFRQAVTAAGTGCMAALDAERWLAAKGFVH